MTLDEMLEAAAGGSAMVAGGWRQGRATFGGLVAGMLVARAEALRGVGGRRMRCASVTFVGPVAPGAVAVEGTVLRAGSSATHVQVRLVQDGEARAVLLASFGAERPGPIAVDAEARSPRPALPDPSEIEPVAHVPGLTPEFFAHVELRFARGAAPYSGAPEPDFGGWMRFARPPARFGDRELMALTDAWPPAILPLLDRPTPVSSFAWTFEPVGRPPDGERDAPDAQWQYDVRTLAAGGGYAHTSARVWDAAGRLRALSRQTVAHFG